MTNAGATLSLVRALQMMVPCLHLPPDCGGESLDLAPFLDPGGGGAPPPTSVPALLAALERWLEHLEEAGY